MSNVHRIHPERVASPRRTIRWGRVMWLVFWCLVVFEAIVGGL